MAWLAIGKLIISIGLVLVQTSRGSNGHPHAKYEIQPFDESGGARWHKLQDLGCLKKQIALQCGAVFQVIVRHIDQPERHALKVSYD